MLTWMRVLELNIKVRLDVFYENGVKLAFVNKG